MKKIFSILIFSALCLFVQAQSFVQLITDTTSHTSRFFRYEIRQFETVTDTLLVDKFPEKWLTVEELKAFQERLIAQKLETQEEARRLFRNASSEVKTHVALYDQIQGAGAYIALQKVQMKEALQGTWKLIERNGETTTVDVTVTEFELRRNAQRFGTLTINDDLTVTLSGYFNFNLNFTLTAGGTFRAERAGKTYVLRR